MSERGRATLRAKARRAYARRRKNPAWVARERARLRDLIRRRPDLRLARERRSAMRVKADPAKLARRRAQKRDYMRRCRLHQMRLAS